MAVAHDLACTSRKVPRSLASSSRTALFSSRNFPIWLKAGMMELVRIAPAPAKSSMSRDRLIWVTVSATIANEFTEAADELYLHALIEIGLVLFIITLIVNGLSRLLIWSMARSSRPARVTATAEPAGAQA